MLNSLIDSSSLSSFAFNDLFLVLSVFFFSPKTNSLIGGDSGGGGGGISDADADADAGGGSDGGGSDGGGGGTLDNSTEGAAACATLAEDADVD
jgi:hypothetical protein